jgi:hypothetical protein
MCRLKRGDDLAKRTCVMPMPVVGSFSTGTRPAACAVAARVIAELADRQQRVGRGVRHSRYSGNR